MKKKIIIGAVVVILGVLLYVYSGFTKLPGGESEWIGVEDDSEMLTFGKDELCELENVYYGIFGMTKYEFDKETQEGIIYSESNEVNDNLLFELENIGDYTVLTCWAEGNEYKEYYYPKNKENIAYTTEYGELKKASVIENREELIIGEKYAVSDELSFKVNEVWYDSYYEHIVVNITIYNNSMEEIICGYAESSTYFNGLDFGALGLGSQGSSTVYAGENEFFMSFSTSFNEALTGEVEEPPYSEDYFWAIGEISIDEKDYWIDITDQVIEKYEGTDY